MLHRFTNNTLRLVRFALRRERIMTPVWLFSLIGITLMVPLVFRDMYGDAADRVGMALTMNNPAMIALCGPIYGTADYTVGAMIANEMILFTLLAVAIMNIFLVIRHTRRDEERGRIEVIRSLPVGRLSNLAATMFVALLINIVLALFSGLGLAALQIESMNFTGSMLYGVVLGVTGLFFSALAAFFAQLTENPRSAASFSMAALGVLYMMRAAGDIGSETLARLSPMGLILRTEVYVRNLWWPVPIVLLISMVIMALAFYLNAIRDMGQGFLQAKPGRKHASALLLAPGGLMLRLLGGTIIGWLVGSLALGISYGSIMGDLEAFLDNDMLKQILPAKPGFSLTELFITMLMSVMAITATIPCLNAALKLHSEEKRNHMEHLASRAVSRTGMMMSSFIISVISSFMMLFAAVLGLWSSSAVTMVTPVAFSSLWKAMMVYLPAVWVMIGFTFLLVGVLPKWTNLSWIYLVLSFFVIYFGRIMQLPEWTGKLSPFGYIPQLPLDEINYTTLAILTLVAIVLAIVGFIGYRRRDLQG